MAADPIGRCLVGLADAQDRGLIEWAANDLEPNREAGTRKATGHRQGRQAGQVGRATEPHASDGRRLFSTEVVGLLVVSRCRSWRGRGQQRGEPVLLKRLPDVVLDESACPLCFQVRRCREQFAQFQKEADIGRVEVR